MFALMWLKSTPIGPVEAVVQSTIPVRWLPFHNVFPAWKSRWMNVRLASGAGPRRISYISFQSAGWVAPVGRRSSDR
jgi:hypothetical protein